MVWQQKHWAVIILSLCTLMLGGCRSADSGRSDIAAATPTAKANPVPDTGAPAPDRTPRGGQDTTNAGPPLTPGAADLARMTDLVAPALRGKLTPPAALALAISTEKALEIGPSGRAVPWKYGDTTGTVTPQPLRRTSRAAQCRDVVQSVGPASTKATACKGRDGRWGLSP